MWSPLLDKWAGSEDQTIFDVDQVLSLKDVWSPLLEKWAGSEDQTIFDVDQTLGMAEDLWTEIKNTLEQLVTIPARNGQVLTGLKTLGMAKDLWTEICQWRQLLTVLAGLKTLGMAEDLWTEIKNTLEQFGDRDTDAPGKQLARPTIIQVLKKYRIPRAPAAVRIPDVSSAATPPGASQSLDTASPEAPPSGDGKKKAPFSFPWQ
ncbi:hypothetical protein T484DRAFT_1824880 [Baffinella frigidus]|nr:hypothetical protein T484DRAFT_1824880 [Cryptophyta sp. CCMP2293]